MTQEQTNVKEFMVKAEQECPTKPTESDYKTRELRVRLLLEEVLEFADASGVDISILDDEGWDINLGLKDISLSKSDKKPDLVEMIDALADIDYVNLGAAVALGVDLKPFQDEVQSSNMSKFIDGHKDEKTGKWIKGKSYRPANLKPILEAQK